MFASILKTDSIDSNQILNLLSKWRKSGALLTYAGTLQSDTEVSEKVLPFLKQFTESVLKGTFAADRYSTSPSKASEHWLKISEEAPALLEKWKKGSLYSEKQYDVVDTDDPCDLLLSGTEVGSCQSVDAEPAFSKCLVAYLMDPKIRMMAAKNKDGVIVARCMMRLLWDKQTKSFVLFQEENYPQGGDPSFADMLNRACKKRAEELGVALLTKDKYAQEDQVTTLQSFKGK